MTYQPSNAVKAGYYYGSIEIVSGPSFGQWATNWKPVNRINRKPLSEAIPALAEWTKRWSNPWQKRAE